ncbi:MAG: phospholipid carrier-dependent glycosyltransferase [Acidobacteria bacterium]|nr:MAG: phospholipid carrier-dependent glycosyltransferase [Acidobacteriota bacterium]
MRGPELILPDRPIPRWVRWALLALLVWYLVIGLWYASYGLAPGRPRFYDERYSLENVQSLIFSDSWRPASFWYPSLAYLPQTAVLAGIEMVHQWTGWPALAIHDGENFTPLAYLVARSMCVLYGAGALLLVFLLGYRMFSPEAGLLAALIFSMVPRYLHHVGFFKPDVLLVMMCALALLVIMRAAERPSLGTYALSGTVIGLALATKLNGGITAIPLVVSTVLNWRHGKRIWFWLAVAGVLSAAIFLVLNPHFVATLFFFRHNLRRYEQQAGKYGGSHLNAPLRQLELLVRTDYHGAVIGTLAIIGIVLLTILVFSRFTDPLLRRRVAVPLTFFYAYSAGCAVVSPFTRFTIVLPMTLVTSLAAAWVIVGLLSRVYGEEPWRRAVVTAALLAIAMLTIVPGTRFVYVRVAPATSDMAATAIKNRMKPLQGREVCSEVEELPSTLGRGQNRAIVHFSESLEGLSPAARARCDAEVWLVEPTVSGEERAAVVERLAAARGSTATALLFEPAPLRRRGPAIAIVLDPWQREKPNTGIAFTKVSQQGWQASLGPSAVEGELITPWIWSPERSVANIETVVLVEGEPQDLTWIAKSRKPRGSFYFIPRFQIPPAGVTLEVRYPGERSIEEIPAYALRWLPPGQEGAGDSLQPSEFEEETEDPVG